jgi:transglutaminase-like putative cysteine protease
MLYRIRHRTHYAYKNAVSVGSHAVYLTPRSSLLHRCIRNEITVTPKPAARSERVDYFGNVIKFFTIQEPHEDFELEAYSEVIIDEQKVAWPAAAPAWDEVVSGLPTDRSPSGLDAYQFIFESPRVRPSAEFAAYALPSFPKGRPITEALLDLTARIHKEFRFDSKATTVSTPSEEVLKKRRGVCQDFAHLQVACLRSLGLAARYVSGYLRTFPPPGRPRLVGADASHAWLSVYCPNFGWLDVDPTNNLVPSDGHVTLAWGRDYSDVAPVRGVILGGRDHKLDVAVDMEPVE